MMALGKRDSDAMQADDSNCADGDRLAGQSELSLGQLAAIFWHHRGLFLAIAVIPLLSALVYLHTATYKYTAEIKVAPPQSVATGLQNRLGGLGGLASLAGVDIGGQPGGQNFQLFSEGVYAHETASLLASEPSILRAVFSKEWDANRRKWQEPSGLIAAIKNFATDLLGIPGPHWSAPNALRLQEFISKNVDVVKDSKSPVVRIQFRHHDPRFAETFLNRLHETVDSGLRQRMLQRTDIYIRYLSAKLATVNIAEHREALAQALSEQEKLKMTASTGVAFAAEPFGQAIASRRPTYPNGPLVLAVALLSGLALASLGTLAIHFVRLRPS